MKTFAILLLLGTLTSFSVKAIPANQIVKQLAERPKRIDGRITNGYPAAQGEVPYIVGLSFQNGWCGGTIISNNFVLTAAHCTNDADGVFIYYGSTWRSQAQFIHMVGKSNFIQHHNSQLTVGNDIALIRTPYITFGDLVNKIQLPSFNDSYGTYENTWAKACGWGNTYNTGANDYLNCVDLEIIDSLVCRENYGVITKGILCIATAEGKNICDNDFGGPLVSYEDNRLVGIASYGSLNCQDGLPAGFTRITSHLDWIRAKSGVAYY